MFGLLVDDILCLCDVVVNSLLVGLVYERGDEDNGGRDQGKTPEWNNLDEVVRDKGTEESLLG
jgi:hypothetical protein